MLIECPGCRAVHRVDAAILGAANGMVRCARCRTVFDARGVAGDREGPGAPGGAADRETLALGRAGLPRLADVPGLREAWLALHNLLRDRRRSLLALSAVGFAAMAMLLTGGFIEWILTAMREWTIASRLGHVQVVRAGYLEEGAADPFAYLLPDDTTFLRETAEAPGVIRVAQRLSFSGLASLGETTVSFLGEGVEPEQEGQRAGYFGIAEGEGFLPGTRNGILVGRGLAVNLGVRPGQRLILLAATAAGGLNAVEVNVQGIFYTGEKTFDDVVIRVPIDLARELLRVSGAHRWVIWLDDTARTAAFARSLEARVQRASQPYAVMTWHALADFYLKTERLLSRQLDVVGLVIGLIIVLSILNLLTMSVLDRTAEIGTLLAVGLRRRQILRIFLAEGALLGLLGGGAGVLIGWGLAIAISAIGIPMPPPPGTDQGFTGEILVTPGLLAGAFGLAVVTATLAGVYPARKASRLAIVDALRHSR